MNPDSGLSEAGGSGATVTYADGRKTRYDWNKSTSALAGSDGPFDILCDNCLPDQVPFNSDLEDGNIIAVTSLADTHRATSSSNLQQEVRPISSSDPMGEAVAHLWASLKHSAEDSPNQPEQSTYEGIYPHERGDVVFKLFNGLSQENHSALSHSPDYSV